MLGSPATSCSPGRNCLNPLFTFGFLSSAFISRKGNVLYAWLLVCCKYLLNFKIKVLRFTSYIWVEFSHNITASGPGLLFWAGCSHWASTFRLVSFFLSVKVPEPIYTAVITFPVEMKSPSGASSHCSSLSTVFFLGGGVFFCFGFVCWSFTFVDFKISLSNYIDIYWILDGKCSDFFVMTFFSDGYRYSQGFLLLLFVLSLPEFYEIKHLPRETLREYTSG